MDGGASGHIEAAVPESNGTPIADSGPTPMPAHIQHHHSHHETVHPTPIAPIPVHQDSLQAKSQPVSIRELHETHKSHLTTLDELSVELEHYFVGPRELDRHSKWPTFLRMSGSILPRLILPLAFMGAWSSAITVISIHVHSLQVSNILLTVLGFVVGLALSFRSTTAYERYGDGRKYWTQLTQTSRNIARLVWLHVKERDGDLGKQDLLGKLTALNLVQAFAVALKHNLRFEPAIAYNDLVGLVNHLETFAKDAHDPSLLQRPRKTPWKATGEYLGVSFAESNPRKLVKRSKKPLGHLPIEILNHLSAYVNQCTTQGLFPSATYEGQLITAVATLNEILSGAERVRDTPLPEAYSIAISQISWIYCLVLPFQLVESLNWLAIPGSIVATYIILSFVAIGRELENPFGDDTNDLPLDTYCKQVAHDIDIITATPPARMEQIMDNSDNLVLYPLSLDGYDKWKTRSVADIRSALRAKVISRKKTVERVDSSMTMSDGSVTA